MKIKDYITIAGIVVPVVGTIAGLAMTDLKVFQPRPDFSINFEPSTDIPNGYKLTVENVGSAQAKNAQLNIVTSSPVNIASIFCPEGVGSAENQAAWSTVKFQKMSTNIQCQVRISDPSATNSSLKKTYYFSVVADDAPGRQLIVNIAPQQSEKKSEGPGVFTPQLVEVILASLFGVALISIVFFSQSLLKTILNSRHLKERKSDLENQIKRTTEELEFLERSITNQQNIPATILERMQWLEDRIGRLNESLAQVVSMLQTSEDTRVYVGDFFTKWAMLERELFAIATKHGLDMRKPIPGKAADFLFSKEQISKKFLEDFQLIRIYRNQLAHGVIIPTISDLKKKIDVLDSLLKYVNDNIK